MLYFALGFSFPSLRVHSYVWEPLLSVFSFLPVAGEPCLWLQVHCVDALLWAFPQPVQRLADTLHATTVLKLQWDLNSKNRRDLQETANHHVGLATEGWGWGPIPERSSTEPQQRETVQVLWTPYLWEPLMFFKQYTVSRIDEQAQGILHLLHHLLSICLIP